ncbi:MAG: endonuclease/exonuclease/phosphatase family protein [Chthoniobacterales bacterium]
MKHPLFRVAAGLGLLCVVFAAASHAQPPPTAPVESGTRVPDSAAPAPLRVAFWNIQWFPGGHPHASSRAEERQIQAVQAEVPTLAADLIGFQEVRDWDSAALAVQTLPGFKVDVCSNFPPRAGQDVSQQVAITSRLQPISAWAEPWKSGGVIHPPRGFAFASYELSPHQILLVYAVHLKSNLGELVENVALREESIRQLIAHMHEMETAYQKLGDLTWIVGGDFNTAPDDVRFRTEKSIPLLLKYGFSWSWENTPFDRRMTRPPTKEYPAACFDHIFYRGARLQNAEVLSTSAVASDHRAVRAEFDFPTAR